MGLFPARRSCGQSRVISRSWLGVLLGSFTRSLPLQALKIWPNRAVVVYFLADASTRALRSLYRRILASRQGMHQLQPVGDRTQTFTEVREVSVAGVQEAVGKSSPMDARGCACVRPLSGRSDTGHLTLREDGTASARASGKTSIDPPAYVRSRFFDTSLDTD